MALAAGIPTSVAASNYCGPGETPGFRFGFAHLKSLLGPTMGEPLECERANAENGDTLQQTTKGLSFYRKATNTPTFTDGWNHWRWTADGLVYWTGDSVDPPGTATPAEAPEGSPAGGSTESRIAFTSDRSGRSEIWTADVSGGSLVQLTFEGGSSPSWAGGADVDTATSGPAEAPPTIGFDAALAVRNTRRSQVPGMGEVVDTLQGMTSRIVSGKLPANVFGAYSTSSRQITISSTLATESAEVIAMVLVHEKQHALDHNLGWLGADSLSCYDSEIRAFDVQILLWQTMWGFGGKGGALTSAEQTFNTMLAIKRASPLTYIAQIIELYGEQCGSL